MHARVLAAFLTAFLATSGIALADGWLNGKNGLEVWDRNRCSYASKTTFKCDLGLGQETTVSFRDEKRKDGCAVRIKNAGTIFTHRWDVWALPPRGWATWTCTVHSLGGAGNTFDIVPPK